MSFKLIREAQTIAKLGNKAEFAKKVQQILGTDSIVPIAEAFDQTSFDVTPQHYNQWLATLTDIAQERGVNVSKRQAFNDIAFEILDNDSLVDAIGGDPERTKQNIVKALWQAYQVSKAHTKVQDHVNGLKAKAREDEEMVSQLVGAEDEESGFEQAFNMAVGVEQEEHTHSKPNHFLRQAVRRGGKTNPYPPNTLRAALWDEAHKSGSEDEEYRDDEMDQDDPDMEFGDEVDVVDPSSMSPEDLASHIIDDEGGGEDLVARVDDLEARVADLETGGTDEETPVDAEMVDELPPEEDTPTDDMPEEKPEPRAMVVDKHFDDEEQVKSMFRKAITAPKEQLHAALKDVEAEGAKAFAGLQMPQNPHPKKSQAYHAWAKGFKNSAKTTFGFNDKPRESTSNHSRSRKR